MQTNEELILDDLANEKSRLICARGALEKALSRKAWREDGWEVPAIDVQQALDILNDGDR